LMLADDNTSYCMWEGQSQKLRW